MKNRYKIFFKKYSLFRFFKLSLKLQFFLLILKKMPEVPFTAKWSISENQFISSKDSVDGIKSTIISNILGFEYYLKIYPNGFTEKNRGKSWIFLYLKLGSVKKVEVDFTIKIESANYSSENIKFTFGKSCSWGPCFTTAEDFFDPEKKFIFDGKCEIRINGIFKFDSENVVSDLKEHKWEGGELGVELWETDENKDFTISVDEKEKKVHKLVLRTLSNVFAAMFKSGMKESSESKVEIIDLSFEVVETAAKMIYNCNFTSSLSIDEIMSLLQFFFKYQIQKLKDKVEFYLIDQISASTVCRITNFLILTNSTKLQNKCLEFLVDCVSSKTALSDFDILDKDFGMKVLQNCLCKTLETDL